MAQLKQPKQGMEQMMGPPPAGSGQPPGGRTPGAPGRPPGAGKGSPLGMGDQGMPQRQPGVPINPNPTMTPPSEEGQMGGPSPTPMMPMMPTPQAGSVFQPPDPNMMANSMQPPPGGGGYGQGQGGGGDQDLMLLLQSLLGSQGNGGGY